MSGSPTGRGYVQGSDSYRADDVARKERERAREQQKFTGVDDLHKDPNDPNFGDYNVPPRDDKMRKALEMVHAYMKEEVDEIGVELLTPENREIWDAVEDALK